MEQNLFLIFFAERIGKPLDAFTKNDWKNAALAAAGLIDELSPSPNKPRRSLKRKNSLVDALKKPRGRPPKDCGDLTIEDISGIVDEFKKPEVRVRWPDAPRSREGIIEVLLSRHTGSGVYARSVVRREREYRNKTGRYRKKRK